MNSLEKQQPAPLNIPAFFRTMAKCLEQMHGEGQSHGAITKDALPTWFTQSGDAFDEEKFRASAKLADQLPENPQVADVRSFVACSIQVIAGETAAQESRFQADHYQRKGWPFVFLKLLESIPQNGDEICTGIADLREALEEEVQETPTTEPAVPQSEEQTSETSEEIPSTPAVKEETSAPSPEEKEPVPTMLPPTQISFALPNGTVGKSYELEPGRIAKAIAANRRDNPEHARISHLGLPKDCGLTFDSVTGSVTGIPTRPLEETLKLDYVPVLNNSSISYTVKLLINPDPTSLWKDLPTPDDAPYQKGNTDKQTATHGPFCVIAASRRGRSHANRGEFRDDDFAIGYAEQSGWLIVVVADGAGSAKFARRGSQVACETARARLIVILNSAEHNHAEASHQQHQNWNHPEVKTALRRILYEAALAAHHKLREEAAQPAESLPTPATLRNYDTTLILLVMKKTNAGWITATYAIGDGGAGLLPTQDEGFPLTRPEGGEHAGQTTFLTITSSVLGDEETLARHFQFKLIPDFVGALVMTDGITDPKFPSDAAFSDSTQWGVLWQELQPHLNPDALLEWLNFFSPGNHDDRTLVAILPAQTAEPS